MSDYKAEVIDEITKSLEAVDPVQIAKLARAILNAGTVFCDGLGRSRLAISGFAMRLGQMGISSALVGEVTAPSFGKGDILLIGTASGSSETLIYHAKEAIANGGQVWLITGNDQSGLALKSAGLLLIAAPGKDNANGSSSIQPMGALFEQTLQIVCDMTVLEIMEQTGITGQYMREHHANIE